MATAANIINYIIYAINFMTILGSLLSFIVFSRKGFEKTSISFYCKCLAFFDLFVVFNLGFNIVSIIINIPLVYSYDWLCKLYYFISVGVSALPAWILVVISFDQLITLSRTEKFQFFKKTWFQYTIMMVIFIFNCAFYSPLIIFASTKNVTYQNETISSCNYNIYALPILYLIESSLLPFLLLAISLFFTLRILIRSRQKVSTNLQGNALAARRRHEYKFAISSIVLDILFIVFNIPIIFNGLFNDQRNDWLYDLASSICYMFFYLNFSLHFWICLTFNSVFRHEILVLFRIKSSNS